MKVAMFADSELGLLRQIMNLHGMSALNKEHMEYIGAVLQEEIKRTKKPLLNAMCDAVATIEAEDMAEVGIAEPVLQHRFLSTVVRRLLCHFGCHSCFCKCLYFNVGWVDGYRVALSTPTPAS